MRLDQWLWAVRVFKTRSRATDAIMAGRVKMNGAAAKPASEARPGAIVTARIDLVTRTLRVIGAPRARVGAKLVAQFAEELTPPEEFEKRRRPFSPVAGAREKGAGRPTKRERREIDELRGE
jgi:ribosome-associated heat shock protein Hsp15